MIKRVGVFLTLLILLAVVAGCPSVKPEPVEPPKVKTPKVELPESEPPAPESNEPEPAKVEVREAEPTKPESPESELNEAKPPKVEPPKAEPAEIEPHPVISFHDKCAGILRSYVDDKGMVDYKTLKRRKLQLKQLLNEFAKLDPNEYNSWPKEDKIAFWINAYNIQMLRIIVDNYPIESSRWFRVIWPPASIRHIPPVNVLGVAKWDKYKFIVMDEEFILAEIERRFFRKEFDEPRVFLALSQASLSSPILRNEPYCGYKLDEQLNDQAKRFLSSSRAFRIDREKKRVHLSAVLQPSWFGREFVGKYGIDKKFKDQQPAVRAVLNFVTNYVSEQDVRFLELENYSIKYINYNWVLNDKE